MTLTAPLNLQRAPAKVSVIIPTYNRSRLLQEAIDSVLNQTYRNFEIIVVDDGSTDDTEQQIRRYGSDVIYVKQKNAGVNAARNNAISRTQSEYIALLDNDDLWLDFKLELQVKLLEEHRDVGFVFSDFLIRKESGLEIRSGLRTWHPPHQRWDDIFEKKKKHSGRDYSLSWPENFDFHTCRGDIYYPSLFAPYVLPSTALIRRSCLDADIRLVDHDPTCGDWDFFSRLSHRYSALFLDLETAVNRSHEDEVRLTRLPQPVQLARRLDMIERVWKADHEFYAAHQKEVDQLEDSLLLKLATQQTLNADKHAARKSLQKRKRLKFEQRTIKAGLLAMIINLPGSTQILRSVRFLRQAYRLLRVSR